MAQVDPASFKRLLEARGTTKAELARKTGIGRNTVQSIAKGRSCHSRNLEKMAQALGASVDELCGRRNLRSEAELREESRRVGIHRLTIHLNSRMDLNYQLVAHRYGLTTDAIVQAAPLCFTILAELSLKRRREAITRLLDHLSASSVGLEHLPLIKTGMGRLDQACDLEMASIIARDLEGRLSDPDGESEAEGPFSVFIKEQIRETGIPETDELGMDTFETTSNYRLFADDLGNISGGSRRAEFALEKRSVTIQQIPKDLRWAAHEPSDVTTRRISWLESKVPELVWQEEEARWQDEQARFAEFLADIDNILQTPVMTTNGGSNA